MQLASSILLLFIVAAVVAFLARRFRVPYTVALVVAGLALGAIHVVTPLTLTKELLFTVFLPGLLFEAALRLELDAFWRSRVLIFSLAVPGIVVASIITVGVLVPALRWLGAAPALGWGAALVFATLISATDPIAVVALVRTLGGPRRLGLLIEGESLLNDGTGVVFFTLAVALLLGSAPSTASLPIDFLYMIGAGVIVGGVIGLAASRLMGRLGDSMLEITLTTIVAYGSFMAADRLQASGVIATVTAGLLCGNEGRGSAQSPAGRIAVGTFWEYVAFALNSLVFLLIGFQVRVPDLLAAWQPILIAYLVVTVARAITTFALVGILPARERISSRWAAVVAWAGLRGGLSMVLALSLPLSLRDRGTIVTLTFGVVILSILLQGLTVSWLLRSLGLVGSSRQRQAFELARGELMTARVGGEELEIMATTQVVAPAVQAALEQEYAARVADAEERLRQLHAESEELPGEELDRARRHLLNVEREHILEAHRMGAMSDAVRDKLLDDVDARLSRSELGTGGVIVPAGTESPPESGAPTRVSRAMLPPNV